MPLYPSAKTSFLTQNPSIDMDSDTIKVALIAGNVSYNSANTVKSSVASYGSTTDQTLTSISVQSGVFDAADATFTTVNVASAQPVSALVIYKDTGTASTSPLIAWIDVTPVTPNGGNITVQWDNTASKIFAL